MKVTITGICFLFLNSVLGLNVMAATYKLSCKFPKLSKKDRIEITVENLYSERPSLNYEYFVDEYDEPAAFSSNQSSKFKYILDIFLSPDGQIIKRSNDGNISFILDSAGCDVGSLKLYKNSRYHKGFLVIEHRCSGIDIVSKSSVYCRIKKLTN